jgi:hypothetical protein
MPDEAYIAELRQKAAELEALRAKMFDPPPDTRSDLQRGADDFLRLPSFEANEYAAAGISDPAQVQLATALHLQPGTAVPLLSAIKAAETAEVRPDAFVSQYSDGAVIQTLDGARTLPPNRDLADAADHRTRHEMEAQKALERVGSQLKVNLVALPKSALDLLILTIRVKDQAAANRAKLGA